MSPTSNSIPEYDYPIARVETIKRSNPMTNQSVPLSIYRTANRPSKPRKYFVVIREPGKRRGECITDRDLTPKQAHKAAKAYLKLKSCPTNTVAILYSIKDDSCYFTDQAYFYIKTELGIKGGNRKSSFALANHNKLYGLPAWRGG